MRGEPQPFQTIKADMEAPRTPLQITAWLERLGVRHAAAGRALGLRDANRTVRAYCSPVGRDAPSETTIMHMALLETTIQAYDMLRDGRSVQAQVLLWTALRDRLGANLDRRFATTSGDQDGKQERT